jgi:hypothetical protein
MNIKPETQKLIDKANQLRSVVIEKTAEEKRYWDTYNALANAYGNAPSAEAMWAAFAAFKRHQQVNPPYSRDLLSDWHDALNAAKVAIAVDAGLRIEAVDE